MVSVQAFHMNHELPQGEGSERFLEIENRRKTFNSKREDNKEEDQREDERKCNPVRKKKRQL